MDIEKLIERLNQYSQSLIAYELGADFADACMDAAAALSTLQAENEKLRAELKQVKADLDRYRSHVERLSPLPDCNTCDSRDCTYRPKIGAFTRINCPLWRGKKGN